MSLSFSVPVILKFYCINTFCDPAETPLPLPLTQGMNSPVPPPRTRHNPFNKLDPNNHQRSHSMRSTNSNSSK